MFSANKYTSGELCVKRSRSLALSLGSTIRRNLYTLNISVYGSWEENFIKSASLRRRRCAFAAAANAEVKWSASCSLGEREAVLLFDEFMY